MAVRAGVHAHVLALPLLLACSAAEPKPIEIRTSPPIAVAHAVEIDPKRDLVLPEQSVCPKGMVDIDGRFCIDRYEASLVEVAKNGQETILSPFDVVQGKRVRAVSEPGVYPHGYVSAVEAQKACKESGKRLCKMAEWQKACRGPDKAQWSYGAKREAGRCNDRGGNPVGRLFGFNYSSWTMNDPRLNQQPNTLAKTGEHGQCTNGYGVFDMVGNLHEWVLDGAGTFVGGYYQDVSSSGHGEGCGYVTTAHSARYHDYSTGFRCCSERKK